MDDQTAEGSGQQRPKNDPRNNQHYPQCANYYCHYYYCHYYYYHYYHYYDYDTTRNTGHSHHQNAANRHRMQREKRVTVQGPVKKEQPNGMSHRGVTQGRISVSQILLGGGVRGLDPPTHCP